MGDALLKFPVEFATVIPVVRIISHIDRPRVGGRYFLHVYYLLSCSSFTCIRDSITLVVDISYVTLRILPNFRLAPQYS